MALAIVESDRLVYLKGYGRADPAGHLVTAQSPFLIGSITTPPPSSPIRTMASAGAGRAPRWRN